MSLPKTFEQLDGELRLQRVGKVSVTAAELVAALDQAGFELGAHSHLRPFASSLGALKDSLKPLLAREADARAVNDAYLKAQLDLARWYADHSDAAQTYAVLRECITSAAVRCLRACWQEPLEDRDHKSCEWHTFKYRTTAEFLLSTAADEKGAEAPQEANRQAFESLRAWLEKNAEVAPAYKQAHDDVQTQRNKVSHCWTGDEYEAAGDTRTLLRPVLEKAMDATKAVGRFVAAVMAAAPLP